jgi:uncharacterized membrane protein
MNLLARRRVLLDYLAGALWVPPTISMLVFLLAGAALSRVEVDDDSPLATLALQGTAEDARSLLMVVSSTMITVTGLVFALTIVALQIASGQYSPRLLRNFMRDRGTHWPAPSSRFRHPPAGRHRQQGALARHQRPLHRRPGRPSPVGAAV